MLAQILNQDLWAARAVWAELSRHPVIQDAQAVRRASIQERERAFAPIAPQASTNLKRDRQLALVALVESIQVSPVLPLLEHASVASLVNIRLRWDLRDVSPALPASTWQPPAPQLVTVASPARTRNHYLRRLAHLAQPELRHRGLIRIRLQYALHAPLVSTRFHRL